MRVTSCSELRCRSFAGHVGPSLPGQPGPSRPRSSAAVSSQCCSIARRARPRIALEDRAPRSSRAAGRSGRCWPRAPGSRAASRRALACTDVTASTTRGEPVSVAMVRCSRESACRWVPGPVGLADRGQRRASARAATRSLSSAPAASAQAPGSTMRRKASASSHSARLASCCRAEILAWSGRALGHDRAAAAPARGLDQPGLAQRGHRLAQRGPRDAHAARPARAPAAARSPPGRRPAGWPWRAARRTPRRRGARGPAGAPPRPARPVRAATDAAAPGDGLTAVSLAPAPRLSMV